METLQPQQTPTETRPILYGKERLIQDIRDFVGKDGYIPLTEHGNQPTMNIYAVDENGVILRFPIGKERKRRIDFPEMDETVLTNVILELFRYQNWCHLYA